jgi:hypothetical protein
MPSMKCRLPRRHASSMEQFLLQELALFRKAGTFASNSSRDFQLFYVGGEDVHAILEYLLSRATTSLYLNECRRGAVTSRFPSDEEPFPASLAHMGGLPSAALRAAEHCDRGPDRSIWVPGLSA